MKKSRFADEQIIGFLKQAEGGVAIKELCRKHGFSDATFYKWHGWLGGMNASEARREAVHAMRAKTGISERRACKLIDLSRTVIQTPQSRSDRRDHGCLNVYG